MTGYSAEKGLAKAIGETLVEEGGRGPLRIAVLAAEASGGPFTALEGAPVAIGRDVAVTEMVKRLSRVEDDIVIGTTRSDEVGARLGEPIASLPRRRVDVFGFGVPTPREERGG